MHLQQRQQASKTKTNNARRKRLKYLLVFCCVCVFLYSLNIYYISTKNPITDAQNAPNVNVTRFRIRYAQLCIEMILFKKKEEEEDPKSNTNAAVAF